jgi:uncharacterized protein with GYD domain
MPIYVRLSKFTPKGLSKVREPAEFFKGIQAGLEEHNCKLISSFVTIGIYDFVSILESETEEQMRNYLAFVEKEGAYTSRTMPGIPTPEFLETIGAHGVFLEHWLKEKRGKPVQI